MVGDGQRLITENGSLIPIKLVLPRMPVHLKYSNTYLPFNGKLIESEKLIFTSRSSDFGLSP